MLRAHSKSLYKNDESISMIQKSTRYGDAQNAIFFASQIIQAGFAQVRGFEPPRLRFVYGCVLVFGDHAAADDGVRGCVRGVDACGSAGASSAERMGGAAQKEEADGAANSAGSRVLRRHSQSRLGSLSR
jgi:hypothetical protein